jgi:hypothetical protein
MKVNFAGAMRTKSSPEFLQHFKRDSSGAPCSLLFAFDEDKSDVSGSNAHGHEDEVPISLLPAFEFSSRSHPSSPNLNPACPLEPVPLAPFCPPDPPFLRRAAGGAMAVAYQAARACETGECTIKTN